MIVRETPWDDADGFALRAAQRAEMDVRYEKPDSEPGPPPSAADITAFLVAYDDDGTAIGCGGLRQLDAEHAEVKRMFVAPTRRGTGVSTAILGELERIGRERGWNRLVLETGDRQPDAIRFYRREGFTRIPNFGYYAGHERSLCFEKLLVPVDPASGSICDGCE